MALCLIQILCLLSFVCMIYSVERGITPRDENSKLFQNAGLVWMENFHGNMYFHYIDLKSNTWNTDSKSVIIARTEEYSFTHIDVAVGLNKTFVMVDALGLRIVVFSFNEYGQHRPWTLFEGTSNRVNGIAIDWITEVVYWTDAAYDVIMATSLQYPHHGVIIVDTDLDEPHGIVVHPNKGFLFWTDTSSENPRLMRSSLGGRFVKEIVRFVTGTATTLHVDVSEDRLYWLFEMNDGGGQRISSCDLFGNYKVDTKVAGNHRFYDMDIFNDQMIFVNQNAKQLQFYSKRRSDKYNNLVLDRGEALPMDEIPYGLRVIDYRKQRSDGNPCLRSDCPGVCTKSNYTEDCFCLNSLKREADDMTVEMYCGKSDESFTGLLILKRDGIYTTWNNFGEAKKKYPESVRRPTRVFGDNHFITALTSDIRIGRIYFYNYDTKAIKSVKTSIGSQEEVVSLAVGNVGGLAFDGVGRNLFWTDTVFGHIMVTNEFGEYPFVLFDDLDQPSEIAIHPQRRKLFWSEYRGVLQVANLDGADRSTVADVGRRRIKGITIDFKTNMVYICTRISIIQIWERDDGEYGYTFLYTERLHYFTGITVLHDYLVLSDTSYKASGLYKFEKPRYINDSIRLIGSSTFLHLSEGNFYGVSYHHISNQPDTVALCTIRKQNCDQLCLSGRRNVRCVCGLGHVTNGSRCDVERPFNPFLFVADQRYGKLFHVHALKGRFIAIPVQGLRQPYAITYDPVRNMVYWSDLVSRTISRSDIEGGGQEVVIYDAESYFVCLEFDPGSRLLFYVARHTRYANSLCVYNVDTGRQLCLLSKSLGDTRSISLNLSGNITLKPTRSVELNETRTVAENSRLNDTRSQSLNIAGSYVFMIEQGNLYRLDLNGNILEELIGGLKATAVATIREHVYYTDMLVDSGRLVVRQCDLNGENSTVFLALKHSEVRDLTIDQNHHRIYWTNSTTRAIFRMRLHGSRRIEQIGPARILMKPAGLFLNTMKDTYDSPCKSSNCTGICLPYGERAICRDDAKLSHIDLEKGQSISGLCTIPEMANTDILNNQAGRIVPHGYRLKFSCYPLHYVTRDLGGKAIREGEMTCRNGQWSDIPQCKLDYEICGTVERGYKVYRKSGVYFSHPEVNKVHVICVGGGGGGFDSENPAIVREGKAGDGGTSRFGDKLLATGGRGGLRTRGGNGGFGHVSGGDGKVSNGTCVTGGTAGEFRPGPDGRPGYSRSLFCGAGGYSSDCTREDDKDERYAGPLGTEPIFSSAGDFGGGAGAREGGTGGGGGWSRLTVNMKPREVINVTVGEPGYPSYGFPAPGVVVVTWGDFRADEQMDILNDCII